MTRDFLSYWKPETALQNLAEMETLGHSASNQYRRLQVGDTVWIVTTLERSLVLLGRIVVGQVMTYEEAVEELGTANLWEADFHITAEGGTALEIDRIPIQSIASRLRFLSRNGNDRLTIQDGTFNAQQLQTMRVIAPSCVDLLTRALQRGRKPREVPVASEPSRFGPAQLFPDEAVDGLVHEEGAIQRVEVNRYERDPKARQECIDHYGTCCHVCGTDLGQTYGSTMQGFIHVHHVCSLAARKGRHQVDPVRDLRPVCPNCHAFLHQQDPPMAITQAQAWLTACRKSLVSRDPRNATQVPSH